jgi:hypothetical protein
MVRKLQRQGDLATARIGTAVRVPESAVEALITRALGAAADDGGDAA